MRRRIANFISYLPLLVSMSTSRALLAADFEERLAGAGTMPSMAHSAKVDVLTRSYDITRTGVNNQEVRLSPANVGRLKKLFSLNVSDDPRLEAQPLIVTDLIMPDGKSHDVVYVCTMDNSIWAFDANTGGKIWHDPVSLGPSIHPKLTPAPGYPTRSEIDLWGINVHWGILSTPVIDRESETMFVVNWTSPDHSIANSEWVLHALNLKDGKDKLPPQKISVAFGIDGKSVQFNPPRQKQRSALLLLPPENSHLRPSASMVLSGGHGHADPSISGTNSSALRSHVADTLNPPVSQFSKKTLIMACGQFGENAIGQHGWVIAFDTSNLQPLASFCTTPKSGGGGIWQAGQGPAADKGGNIFVMTSNGGWDGAADFSESFLMLHYNPPTENQTASFNLRTWFTPFRDDERTAHEPGSGYDFRDQDLGSAGPIVPSGMQMVFGAGKDGVLYVLQKGDFGNTVPETIDTPANFQKLKSPPIFFTFFPGFNINPTLVDDLDHNYFGKTHHQHGSPVFWKGPDGNLLFCWGENDTLRAWSVSHDGKVTFKARGREIASEGVPKLGGMPGGMLTLSANAAVPRTGLIWGTAPLDGDGNHNVVEGILRVYDASDFGPPPTPPTDPDSIIKLLWDSKKLSGNTFKYNKFCPPVIANGNVYVATYDGSVDVYGISD